MKRHIRQACITGLLALGLLSGCDAVEENPQSLSLKLYGGTGLDDPWDGVSWIKATVRGDNMAEISSVSPLSARALTLPDIPFSQAGEKRTVTLEGYSDVGGAPGFLVSRGRSEPFEVYENGPVHEAQVFVSKVNNYSALASSATSQVQRLQQGRFAPTVTVTSREILISGGANLVRANARWWGGEDFNEIFASQEAIPLDGRMVSQRSAMTIPRIWHTATPFPSGQVVIAGGFTSDKKPTASAELYNPPGVQNGTPAGLPPLAVARAGHTMTLISEAEALFLVIGGDEQGTWELWSAHEGSRGAQPLPDGHARSHHQATVFKPANSTTLAVLITGGESKGTVLPSAMLFDTATRELRGLPTGMAMIGGPRTHHTATWVPERNYIYIAGGFSDSARQSPVAQIDVFQIPDLKFNEHARDFRLHVPRGGHQAVLLDNNAVYLSGGYGNESSGPGTMRSMEWIYEYVDAATNSLRVGVDTSFTLSGMAPLPNLTKSLFGHRVVNMNGMAVVLGGATSSGSSGFQVNSDIFVYNPR